MSKILYKAVVADVIVDPVAMSPETRLKMHDMLDKGSDDQELFNDYMPRNSVLGILVDPPG